MYKHDFNKLYTQSLHVYINKYIIYTVYIHNYTIIYIM